MTQKTATILGFGAVLLWALLALFTTASAPIPPLQLNALCFGIGGSLGLVWVIAQGRLSDLRAVPIKVYIFGTAGLFGYHFLYFSALRIAPPAQAGLIAYLWPLLIVLFSGLLPNETLRRGHVIGALIGLSGAALIIANDLGSLRATALPGYGLALLCALTWSGYSVGSRVFGAVPTASVVVFCLASAALSAIAHAALEQTHWPIAPTAWLAVLGLGVGPVGLAFFIWDIGVKKGDIQLLGTASYAAPLLSTLALVIAGVARPTLTLAFAALLITGGAVLAARASRATKSGLREP